MKTKLLLLTLILFSFITSAFEFSIAVKPGVIKTGSAVISLGCQDSLCYYTLDLPEGTYLYEANDGTSCSIQIIKDSIIINDTIIKIIK